IASQVSSDPRTVLRLSNRWGVESRCGWKHIWRFHQQQELRSETVARPSMSEIRIWTVKRGVTGSFELCTRRLSTIAAWRFFCIGVGYLALPELPAALESVYVVGSECNQRKC